MSGIYIHIPFCRRACVYCDFHFSTSMRYKSDFVKALVKEIEFRKNELQQPPITLYFGGGTPSQLNEAELHSIFSALNEIFPNNAWEEITFEANPEDLSTSYLNSLKSFGINRLSIGVQSFDEDLLRYMNREHSKTQAIECIEQAYTTGFEHISIDLIYGVPRLSKKFWKEELRLVEHLPVKHLSCYALTVEQGTPLAKSIRLRKTEDVDDHAAALHFAMLQHWAGESGWEHYEVSNLCKPDNRALHNSAYWSGAQYLGLGPAAHSFQGLTRRINIANNTQYIHSLLKGKEVAHTMEKLSLRDRFNEMILTGIRTANGIDVSAVRNISRKHAELLLQKIQNEADKYDYDTNESSIKLKTDYWFQSDGIAADLMILEKEWLI